ncbi:hypothetical protein ABB37_00881 [Leptomonas pyrrhocoris]|uniref:Uncharacterized protein n=1 Tax=Leptomonas pyrrhocoris TaxID=157538 RepID=A0A0M9GBL4_LEPPY|nr:hypothetical protein ABB37_00881 [Leptomonas pyrrhocoris]KPA86826.1 hypothetical protein ABB37_00881 [Leptomonas pyrrhocoris]|eukprot:XP_015665265.1 hypothetical protein ABB37_00881 [Leptomonas pyrrhocoris]
MAFHLSTVVAYMCGVEVPELQLSFFLSNGVEPLTGEASTEGQTSATLTERSTMNIADQRRGATPASGGKPSRCAEWMWRVRGAFVTSVRAQKDTIIAAPPPPKATRKRDSDAMCWCDTIASQNHHMSCDALAECLHPSETVPLTEVVAQSLPCLGCTPFVTSALPSSSSSSEADELRWGVPCWPMCTITIPSQETGKTEKTLMTDEDGDGAAPASCAEDEYCFHEVGDTSSHDVAGKEGIAASPTVLTSAMTEAQNGDERCGGEGAPRLAVRVGGSHAATFRDPAPSLSSSLPSSVPPPRSLLLPDMVCLRHTLPPYSSTAPSSLSSRTVASASTNDEPTVELLLIAVESLPELWETRRQGLLLYTKVLLHLYATAMARASARRPSSEEGEDGASAGRSALPSLQWRCELWTPPAEGRAAGSSQLPPTSTAAANIDGTVCRTVVQSGLFSPYTSSRSGVASPPTSLGEGSATTPSIPDSLGLRVVDRVARPSKAACVPSPVLYPRLGDLTVHLRTFCRWWEDMEQLARQLTSPTVSRPTAAIDAGQALSETATTASDTTTKNNLSDERGAIDMPGDDTTWARNTVEQLLWWWAAKSVRPVARRTPPPSSSLSLCPPLPPLPSGAAPLFGAVVVPTHVRAAPAATMEEACGSASPPALPLPSLNLCFVNPRGAYAYQYDLEALNVLCRAVHLLHASVCVVDAAQKAALMTWMRCFVRPVSTTNATAGAASSLAAACHADTTNTPDAAAAYFEYSYDALAEVEKSCLILEDYVYERHRRLLADNEKEEGEDTAGEEERNATVQTTAQPPLSSCGILGKARAGAVPTRAWCHDARVLAWADFLGRRRLDVFTCPLGGPSQRSPATKVAAAAAPPLLLNAVPPSFLSYLLTRIADSGVEAVEQLSGTILQMGRRLSGG